VTLCSQSTSSSHTGSRLSGGIGLARMAWRLAFYQIDGRVESPFYEPATRRLTQDGFAPYSANYYRIIDCISRGVQP
jgi:hypothetical protein